MGWVNTCGILARDAGDMAAIKRLGRTSQGKADYTRLQTLIPEGVVNLKQRRFDAVSSGAPLWISE